MSQRSKPRRRVVASIVGFSLVGTLTGCGSDRVYEQAIDGAESGVAILLELTATQVGDLLANTLR